MSDRYFVDTNILMFAHDTAAGKKHARAKALVEQLWESRSDAVSTQVLQELAVNLRRKARKLELEARYKLSFWDALVVQAAYVAGAEILYSEDLSDGQRYGTLRVKNPLTNNE